MSVQSETIETTDFRAWFRYVPDEPHKWGTGVTYCILTMFTASGGQRYYGHAWLSSGDTHDWEKAKTLTFVRVIPRSRIGRLNRSRREMWRQFQREDAD